jgi:hypothetical protein
MALWPLATGLTKCRCDIGDALARTATAVDADVAAVVEAAGSTCTRVVRLRL